MTIKEKALQAKISSANRVLISGGLTLTVFWVLNIFKTANPAVKSFLTFYQPIGPLLGLYVVSVIAFFIFRATFKYLKVESQNQALWFYAIAITLFVLMVFPPIFEPIVHLLVP